MLRRSIQCALVGIAETRSYLINGFVAAKPQTGRNGIRRKVMIWLSFNGFIL
jgi:hypothetical protein